MYSYKQIAKSSVKKGVSRSRQCRACGPGDYEAGGQIDLSWPARRAALLKVDHQESELGAPRVMTCVVFSCVTQ